MEISTRSRRIYNEGVKDLLLGEEQLVDLQNEDRTDPQVMGFNPEVLRETDFKGAFGCFAMLTWALVMTGRLAYVGTLYTSALTGVVVQYALLQARARYSPDPQSDDEQARESEPSECNLDPCSVSQRGGGKYSYYPGNGRTALDGGCGRCCDLQTTCARGQGKRNNVLAEIMVVTSAGGAKAYLHELFICNSYVLVNLSAR